MRDGVPGAESSGPPVSETAAFWSGASYERIAATFAPVHEQVVRELGVGAEDRVLDLACGTGGVALVAARAGADVVGLDISPDQLAKARLAAEAAGLSIRFDEGDCQALPYEDASFDVAASVFGFVFAASDRQAAAELARVVRSGGRIAFTGWTDDEWSRVGERLGRPFPEGDDAREWGKEAYVREQLGASFELGFEWGEWVIQGSPQELWELSSTSVPPLKGWLDTLDPESYEEAEQAYLALFASGELRRRYLLAKGSRR
jgi:SAM-dependent methyltransferase